MTQIDAYEPDSFLVPLKNKKGDFSFKVFGLTFEDISYLMNLHLNDFEAAYALIERAKQTVFSGSTYEQLAFTLVQGAPGLVAEVISVAAQDRDRAAHYAKVPFSVTVNALANLIRLTLEDVGGLKNLTAMMASLYQARELPESAKEVPPSPESLPPEHQSLDSTGASENK